MSVMFERDLFFRDQLRAARAMALADAEGFFNIIQVLERIGQQLSGRSGGLGYYENAFVALAGRSELSDRVAQTWPQYHAKFKETIRQLRVARNEAVHQGTYARHIADHAIDVAIVLEGALVSKDLPISCYMVRGPMQAHLWQPVSYIRQQMLKYAFSYMPIWHDGEWSLLSDYGMARYLRGASDTKEYERRMLMSIGDALKQSDFAAFKAPIAQPTDMANSIAQEISEKPVLVIDRNREDVLLGIVTPSDIL